MAILLASLLLLGASLVFGTVVDRRQGPVACPLVHIFGARETNAPPGLGSTSSFIDSLIAIYPTATYEAIDYPACDGQASCGNVSYADSVAQGVAAVASQVNAYSQQCPNSPFTVLVGYGQGGQIMDDASCGGGDIKVGITNTSIPISPAALSQIIAAIYMGSPRHTYPPYTGGSCAASGLDPRPTGLSCLSPPNIRSYCDTGDPYCCGGDDPSVHQGYEAEYGGLSASWVQSLIANRQGGGNGSTYVPPKTSTPTTPSPTSGPTPTPVPTAVHWGQCGGTGWTGPTACASGYTCTYLNPWYSQCL